MKKKKILDAMAKEEQNFPPACEFIRDYKIKKHKTQWYDKIIIRLDKELKETKDFRSKVLILHLYIEYRINELIRATHKSPEIIIDDDKIGEFGNKIKILRSRNFIYEDLLKNLKQIQEIRNHYSHTLLMKDELDNKIKNMKLLYMRKNLDISEKSFEEKFVICALDTFKFLDQLTDSVLNMIPRPF